MIYKTRSSPQNCRGFDPASSIILFDSCMIVVSLFYYCLYLDLFSIVAHFIKQYGNRKMSQSNEKSELQYLHIYKFGHSVRLAIL